VLSQRANIASLEAQVESTRGQLKVQRDVLAFLTGLPADSPLKDEEGSPAVEQKLDAYLEGARGRPDILASSLAVQASHAAVSAARALHWPTADLSSNYYLKRPGGSHDINWDVTLSLSFPIFQGGAIQSQVRQAVAVQEQVALGESRARRLADQEVKRFFERVESGRLQLVKLTEFVNLSRLNHDAQRKEYRNGLVTNLDVLQATTSWHVAVRSKERQLFTLKGDYAKLQAASGMRAEVRAAAN
jgi:outer membrane protein